MKITRAMLVPFLVCVLAMGCSKECDQEAGCLAPDQCYDSPNLTRYALPSRGYVVAQSSVGLDQCQFGRRSGDWNGLNVTVAASDATLDLAMRVSNGVDLGSGHRNPQPFCNAGSLSNIGVAGSSGACTFSIAFDTQVRLIQDGAMYLSITETHSDHSAVCPNVGGSCVMIYDVTLQ